jgi:hypothetical protein
VQGYEGGQLAGQALRILPGAVTVGQFSPQTGEPIEIKIWSQNASQPSDSQIFDVNDCSIPRLTTPMLLIPETPLHGLRLVHRRVSLSKMAFMPENTRHATKPIFSRREFLGTMALSLEQVRSTLSKSSDRRNPVGQARPEVIR